MQLTHKDLKIKAVSETDTTGTFEITPLPRGFGYTVGNTLRRVLLTSLSGAAITQIKVTGANHQFSTIEGVKEDLVEIILKLKRVRFKIHTKDPVVAMLKVSGPREVTAKDIETTPDLEILNKNLHIATLADEKSSLEIELLVEEGIGYSPMEERKTSKVGVIIIDAIYSPVLRVQIDVKETRAGEKADLDKLILNIETDGSITPTDAVYKSSSILFNFFKTIATWEYKDEEELEIEEEPQKTIIDPQVANTTVEDLPLQTRTINALKNHGVKTLAEIAEKTSEELSDIKNLGEKSVKEINKLLISEGLK